MPPTPPVSRLAGTNTHWMAAARINDPSIIPVSYTHLRAHETVLDLVCRLLAEKKKKKNINLHTEPEMKC